MFSPRMLLIAAVLFAAFTLGSAQSSFDDCKTTTMVLTNGYA